MHQRRLAIPCILVFLLASFAFYQSRRSQVGDSKYTLLLTHQLLTRGRFELDRFAPPPWGPGDGREVASELPQQFMITRGHVYYLFPAATSLLAVPFLLATRSFGLDVVDSDGYYRVRIEKKLQRLLAAVAMGGLVGFFFLTARLLLPQRTSVAVAALGGFGTQVWSTASRALWSHTFQILFLGIAIHLLLRAAENRSRPNALALATLLSWAYFVRPTSVVSILGISIYLVLVHREVLLPYFATGGAWAGAFVAHSWSVYGQLLPPYHVTSSLFQLEGFSERLLGVLVSPARGLLVYVPSVLVVAYLLWAGRRCLPHLGLVRAALGCIFLQLLMISCFVVWWGGHCYGARYVTDVVPWFVLLGVLGLRARIARDTRASRRSLLGLRRAEVVILAPILLASIAINGVGAISKGASLWSARPESVDRSLERLWDWSDPPFLRWRILPPPAAGAGG